MERTLEDQIHRIVASIDTEEQNGQEQETPGTTEQAAQPDETIHIHYFPDAIIILKEDENIAQVVESAPVTLQKISFMPAYAISLFYFFLVFSCIVFQVYEILNPPIVTITILPKSQTVTLTGTLQLGRVVSSLTISQSQTVPTTGKGHHPAKSATGYITFYNGQLNSVTIATGAVLAGSDRVQIVTDQDAYIPAESQSIPPTLGQTTVSAHALEPGTRGNILTGDINQGCCAPSVLAQNTSSFRGGQDERNFQTVARADISSVVPPLKTAVAQSMSGALQGQVQSPEQLFILPCAPTQTSDHQIGAEATQVKVTVLETCSAVAYNSQEFEVKATGLLNRQAATQPGTGYSLFGTVRVVLNQATVTHTTTPLVFLSFKASGTWVYALDKQSQQHIKKIIAGRTKQVALHLLSTLPGIEQASISWGDDTRLPKDPNYLDFVILYGLV